MRYMSALARNIAVLTVALTLMTAGNATAEAVCIYGVVGSPGDDDYIECVGCTDYRNVGTCSGEICKQIWCVDNDGGFTEGSCRSAVGRCAN